LELIRNKKSFAWWGSFQRDSNQYGEMTPERMGTCEHAIRVKGTRPQNGSGGPWEIGVFRTADGNLGVAYDEYGSAGRALTETVAPGRTRIKLRKR
jgi:hypothetical protein